MHLRTTYTPCSCGRHRPQRPGRSSGWQRSLLFAAALPSTVYYWTPGTKVPTMDTIVEASISPFVSSCVWLHVSWGSGTGFRIGNSLAIQWLGLSTFTSMAQVQSLVRERKVPQSMRHDQKNELYHCKIFFYGSNNNLLQSLFCLVLV